MTDYFRPERFMCRDCGHDCREMGEMYMVHDWIWAWVCQNFKVPNTHMLCIGCIEERFGRNLTKDDFTDAPQNRPWDETMLGRPYHQSLRLRSRLSSSMIDAYRRDVSHDPFYPRAPERDRSRVNRMIDARDPRD